MPEISFIHAADLHLDSPFVGFCQLHENIYKRIQNSTFDALERLVDLSIERDVDFIIIAGDLYDDEDRSIRAQIFFKKQMERLKQAGIFAYVIHGNHDHLAGRFANIAMPSNVIIFNENVEVRSLTTKNGAKIHLYGFSYPRKHVLENMLGQYEKVEGADYHIGILHGHDSINKAHIGYAPFQVSELKEKQFDYFALGHIHKSAILSKDPYIVYSGNTQGRNIKETGPKGCYLVKMNGRNTKLEFLQTSQILFENVNLKLDKTLKTFDELYETISNLKEQFRANESYLIQLTLNSNQIDPTITRWIETEDFLDLIHAEEERHPNFVWLYKIGIKGEKNIVDSPVNESFLNTLKDVINDTSHLQSSLAPIFDHVKTKRFIQTLTKEEEEEIMKEAEKLIYQYLYE